MLKEKYPYYLANKAVYANEDLQVIDKFSGEVATSVAMADADTIDKAIQAACDAEEACAKMAAYERKAVLEHCVMRFKERFDELAESLCIEAGKPIKDAKGEVTRLIDTFQIAAEESVRITGEVMPLDISPRARGYTGMWKRVPIGPCSFISPFNFPLNLAAHKIAPAIATNNCVVCKPTEQTPLTAITLADILYEAGLPPEMFQIVTGWPKDIGDEMITNENIDIVTFTGGVPVGKMIAEKAGYKRTALELGGNDPLIVLNDLDDADLEKAAALAVAGATGNSGQRCTAVKRILVQESVADRFVPFVLEKAKAIRFGDPMDPETQLGCVIHAQAAELFEKRVYMAAEQGAKVLYDPGRKGALLPPIVVDHVPHDSELVMEETFGPIVPIVRVPDDDAEVMRISNSTPFGLSSGVCTNDFRRMQAFIEGLNVGTVNIWEQPGYRIEMSPFGGIKDSGNGVKEGVLEAMKFFTNVKTYSLPWPR